MKPTRDQYKIHTSGCGSNFSAWVMLNLTGGMYDGRSVAKAEGFRSRSEAMIWGRRKIADLLEAAK